MRSSANQVCTKFLSASPGHRPHVPFVLALSILAVTHWSAPLAFGADSAIGPTVSIVITQKEKKEAATKTGRSHRLIRRPTPQTSNLPAGTLDGVAGQQTHPDISGDAKSAVTVARKTAVSKDESPSMKNTTSSNAAIQTVLVPSVKSSTTSGQPASTSIGSPTASSTAAVASPGGGGGGKGRGRSVQHLVSELPTITQIIAPPAPQPAVTPPPIPVPPVIGASPLSFSFNTTQGNSSPSPQTLTISNTGGGTLAWSATDNAAWLSVSPATGSGNASLTLNVSPAALSTGTHSAMVTLNAAGAQPITIPVTVTVAAAPVPPSIGVSPTSLTFTAQQGGSDPSPQTLSISNTGGGTLSWSASDNATWVSPSPFSGAGNGMVTVRAMTGSLTAGTYTGSVTISGEGTSSRVIPVTFTISAPAPPPPQPTIGMSPSSLTFTATAGGSSPASRSIAVSNSGTGTLTWTAADNAGWLTATQSGSSIVAAINVAGLAAGTYNASITVTASGATNTPQSIPVTLTVSAAPPTTTGSVSLTWTANSESDLAGYKVYRATASGAYGAPIASVSSSTTQYVSSGLAIGTYFFVVTAFDQSGNESSPSTEVSKSIY